MDYWLYLMNAGAFYKIGIAKDVDKRRAELQTGNPLPIRVVTAVNVESEANARRLEANFLYKLRTKRAQGEWVYATKQHVMQVFRELFA